MDTWAVVGLVVLALVVVALLALSIRVVKQYERGVLFRFGRLKGSGRPVSASSSRSSTSCTGCRCAS